MRSRNQFGTLLAVVMVVAAFTAVTLANRTEPRLYSLADNSSLYSVKTFGAKGDGKTLDTPAINKAIDAAASAGGGTVRFPAGTYRCFSIHLKSNVALYLDQGSTILAADNPLEEGAEGYDPPEPNEWDPYEDLGHSHWHNSLIWGENLENISILGPGRIDGKGLTTGGNPRRRGGGTQSSQPAEPASKTERAK